jgi:glutamyl-Q tRNA(Asp) synthetase
LLDIAAPRYRHHRLVRDSAGQKMSKSASSTTLEELRRNGVAAEEVRAALGFGEASAGALLAAIS